MGHRGKRCIIGECLTVEVKPLGKLFMYIEYNRRPITDPWGTPIHTRGTLTIENDPLISITVDSRYVELQGI